MANKEAMAPGTSERPKPGLSDAEIKKKILQIHLSRPEVDFDFYRPLFLDVKNVLQHATHIVDNALAGKTERHRDNQYKLAEAKRDYGKISSTVKELSSQLSRKASSGDPETHKTTESILKKAVRIYSWEGKAVLTLVAFALDYGDFWGLTGQLHSLDQLIGSLVGIGRKDKTAKLKHPDLEKYREQIVKLKNLVKNTLELIKGISKLHELLRLNIYDVPEGFSTARELVPMAVYWSIYSLVACTTQMYRLASKEDNTRDDLSPLAKDMIETTYDSLKEKIKLDLRQKGDACWKNDFESCKMDDWFEIPEEIVGAFMDALIETNDKLQIDHVIEARSMFNTRTKKRVSINVLKKKNILLLISSLDISDDEISIVKAIDDVIRKKDPYKILWIPIAEQWTDHDTQNKFESQCRKMTSWYILRYPSLEGIEDEYLSKYAEDWQFKEPMVVVINPQGELENPNAFRVIRLHGMGAFPFTTTKEKSLIPVPSIPVLRHPNKQMTGPYKLKRIYKFYYGGKREWIKQFTIEKSILVDDQRMQKLACIEFCFYGKGRLIFNQDNKSDQSDQEKNMKLQIKRGYSHLLDQINIKHGWLVLTEGSTVLFTFDQGKIILKVFEQFCNWKNRVNEHNFDACFKEYYDKLLQPGRP